MALGDTENQGLFHTGVGSVESPPEAECLAFILGIFYTSQSSGSLGLPTEAAQILTPQAAEVPAVAMSKQDYRSRGPEW